MPYFEFMLWIDEWIEKIENDRKEAEKQRQQMESERKQIGSQQKSNKYKK